MTGVDLLITIGGISVIVALLRQMRCNRRADLARERHEENRRAARVIERLEAYSYFDQPTPDYVPFEWEQAA